MSVRMEKVAALRRLFAEYGYAPTGADDGMDKEAMNRLMKYLAKVGPEKARAAWERALNRASGSLRREAEKRSLADFHSRGGIDLMRAPRTNSIWSRLRDFFGSRHSNSSGDAARKYNTERIHKAMKPVHALRADITLKERLASANWAELLDYARRSPEFRQAHRADLRKAFSQVLKQRRKLRRISKISMNPDHYKDMTRARYGDFISGKPHVSAGSRRNEAAARLRASNVNPAPKPPLQSPLFYLRYMKGDRTPASVLRRYAPLVLAARLPVRRSAYTPEIFRISGTPRLSSSRLRELTGGLVDRRHISFRGARDLHGRKFGQNLYAGPNTFMTPHMDATLPFAAGTNIMPADLLAGLTQVKKNDYIIFNKRVEGGYTGDKLHQPVFGTHIGTPNITDSAAELMARRKALRRLPDQGVVKLKHGDVPYTWEAHDYETVGTGGPGGSSDILWNGMGERFDARAADMARVRARNLQSRRDWVKQMTESRAVQDMTRRGYLSRRDVLSHVPDPGVIFDVQPGDVGDWPAYIRSLGGGRFA